MALSMTLEGLALGTPPPGTGWGPDPGDGADLVMHVRAPEPVQASEFVCERCFLVLSHAAQDPSGEPWCVDCTTPADAAAPSVAVVRAT